MATPTISLPPSSPVARAALAGTDACRPAELDALARLGDLRSSIERLRREREALLAELRQLCSPYRPFEGLS